MLFYLTTPFTDVSEALGHRVEDLFSLEVTKNGWVRVWDQNGLIYYFDRSFRCTQVTAGHGYESAHDELLNQGKLTSVLGQAYDKSLIEAIRYWDGTGWTAEPTMVKR